MRLGRLEIDRLVRVRKTFRLRWRLPVAAFFGFMVYSFWMAGAVLDGGSVEETYFPFEARWIEEYGHMLWQTWAFLGGFLGVTAFALLRRDDFARVYFALASGVPGVIIGVFGAFAIGSSPDSLFDLQKGVFDTDNVTALGGLAFLFVLVIYLLRWSWLLWLSVVPLGRGRALRQQVIHSLRAESGRKRSARTRQRPAPQSATFANQQLLRFLIWGCPALIVGVLSFVATFIAASGGLLAEVADENGWSDGADIIRAFDSIATRRYDGMIWHISLTFGLLIFCYCNFLLFGFLWNRWRRSRISIWWPSPTDEIPPGSALLLRHSKDDDLKMPGRNFGLSRLLFWAFERNYTFEQVMALRLAFVGSLQSLGSRRDMEPIFDDILRKLMPTAERRSGRLWRRLGTVAARLLAILPRRLPPLGAPRVYFDDNTWRAFVRRSLPAAQMVVVVIGSTKNGRLESPYLHEELEWLCESGYFRKTLFVMPPVLSSTQVRERWAAFTDYLFHGQPIKELLPKTKRVLAVCFYGQDPVIITGSDKTELFYEAVLDVAGSIAGDVSNRVGEMIDDFVGLQPTE